MLIDNLNKMMQTPFKINTTLLDYLQDNIEFFFLRMIILLDIKKKGLNLKKKNINHMFQNKFWNIMLC